MCQGAGIIALQNIEADEEQASDECRLENLSPIWLINKLFI
jgi:hypothetical protein